MTLPYGIKYEHKVFRKTGPYIPGGGVGGGPGAGVSNLLLEDGSDILLEGLGVILLEP